jgi:small-conductance mechanosensitive channel
MLPELESNSVLLTLLYALGVVAILCLLGGVVYLILSVIDRHRRAADENSLAARIVVTLRGPVVLFMAIVGLLLAYEVLAESDLRPFQLLRDYHEWAVRIWLVIVVLEVSYLVSHLLQALMLWYVDNIADRTATDLDEKLIPQVRRVTPVFVYAIGGLMALDFMGISITPLVAGLGIGGLAVALAIQPTLSSFLSGTYLITEGELNEGDFIELDKGPSGFVIDVGWRSTKIRDRFNNLIMIPNSKMIESVMTNYYSQSRVMTVLVSCGISYESDLRHVERVALEVARDVRDDVEEAQDDYEPLIYFTAFGESNIDFVLLLQAVGRKTKKKKIMKNK